MLGDAGSVASIVGAAVSLLGLGFVIWQVFRLRGEARAARAAAEETQKTVARDLAITDISRMDERMQALKRMHLNREWSQCLFVYSEVYRGLTYVQNRFPGLSEQDTGRFQKGVVQLQKMERIVEAAGEGLSPETAIEFNEDLREIQLMLNELEGRLHRL